MSEGKKECTALSEDKKECTALVVDPDTMHIGFDGKMYENTFFTNAEELFAWNRHCLKKNPAYFDDPSTDESPLKKNKISVPLNDTESDSDAKEDEYVRQPSVSTLKALKAKPRVGVRKQRVAVTKPGASVPEQPVSDCKYDTGPEIIPWVD